MTADLSNLYVNFYNINVLVRLVVICKAEHHDVIVTVTKYKTIYVEIVTTRLHGDHNETSTICT